MTAGARRAGLLHVERTADPAVLRWVVHHPAVATSPAGARQIPPGAPAWEALLASHEVAELAVGDGDIWIRAADPGRWAVIAPLVRDALTVTMAELDRGGAAWLLQPDDPSDLAAGRWASPSAGGLLLSPTGAAAAAGGCGSCGGRAGCRADAPGSAGATDAAGPVAIAAPRRRSRLGRLWSSGSSGCH